MNDPRLLLRDALRALVREDPAGWSTPSLEVFRNRLLDRTGSDFRPYAELLTEAARRGWCQRLAPLQPGDPRWDAQLTPFVMHWSAERFVQPEMARWAAESWGVALGVIDVARVRVAPPPAPPAPPAPAPAPSPRRPASGGGVAAGPSPLPARGGGGPVGGAGIGASSPRRPWRVPTRSPAPPPAYGGAGGAGTRPGLLRGPSPINPRIPRLLLGAVGVLTVAFGVQVASTTPAATPAPAIAAAPVTAAPVTVAPAAVAPTSGLAAAPPAPGGAGAVPSGLPESPGVPSLTRTLLPTAADSGRLMLVQPARRAAGEGTRLRVPPPATSAAYDELHLVGGEVWRGTVEVVRAGTVLFRDRRTGLRHEVRKEAVDRIITEFGSTVRFRAAGATGAPVAVTGRAPAARRADAATVRGRGVGGRYLIRFEGARVDGSAACREAWRREAGASERAEVRHDAGADTLVVAFVGGDQFPSTIDPDGYFASTFRIVPDQARSSTALTTRLTGRFDASGGVAVTVNIVFYRRLRTGEDLACAVAIPGRGAREADTAPSPAPSAPRARR